MFPFYLESPDDLVPLPLCEGPKLKPFAFQDQQNIEFFEYLGEGAHSYVWKVKIDGSIYALKMFKFSAEPCYMGMVDASPSFQQYFDEEGTIGPPPPEDVEALHLFCNYSEPFNAECRAFGRLQEAGREEVALKCFGYLLLDEKHERAFMEQCGEEDGEGNPFYFETCDEWYVHLPENVELTTRYRFAGENGKLPPIRCIVKELGHASYDVDDELMQARNARRILQDINRLHQLGIFHLDFAARQLINGKLADLSWAVTTPHYLTNPEFNPRLTPDMVADMEFQTFAFTSQDYWRFDLMMEEWNWGLSSHLNRRVERKKRTLVYAMPPNTERTLRRKHNLRSSQSPKPPYTLADPRRFDWKASAAAAAEASAGADLGLRRSNRLKAKATSRGKSPKGIAKRPAQLLSRPPRWYFQGSEAREAKLRVRCWDTCEWLRWRLDDGLPVPRSAREAQDI